MIPLSSILIIIWRVDANLRVPRKQHLASPGEEVTMATLPRVNLPHLSHWSGQWNRLHLPHIYLYLLFTGELVGGTIDRAALRETQHGNHATQMCPLAHWAATYIQQTVHVTQRHSYLHQSRHRDSATANVMHRHSYLHQIHSRDMVAAILQAAPQLWRTITCDTPSQLISLVLLTASLELLGSEIRSRQAFSIPKRKTCLAAETLSLSGCGLGSIVISRYRYSPPGKRTMARC